MSSTFAYSRSTARLDNRQRSRTRSTAPDGSCSSTDRRAAGAASAVRVTLRGRLVAMVTLLAVALALFTFVGSPAASTPTAHHATSPTVVVQPGQTLWDIAAETAPGSDPRDVVAAIVELNTLADPGAIRAGQPLYVPAN